MLLIDLFNLKSNPNSVIPATPQTMSGEEILESHDFQTRRPEDRNSLGLAHRTLLTPPSYPSMRRIFQVKSKNLFFGIPSGVGPTDLPGEGFQNMC